MIRRCPDSRRIRFCPPAWFLLLLILCTGASCGSGPDVPRGNPAQSPPSVVHASTAGSESRDEEWFVDRAADGQDIGAPVTACEL